MELSEQSKAKLEAAVVQVVEKLTQTAQQAVTRGQQLAAKLGEPLSEQGAAKLEATVVQTLVSSLFTVAQIAAKHAQSQPATEAEERRTTDNKKSRPKRKMPAGRKKKTASKS